MLSSNKIINPFKLEDEEEDNKKDEKQEQLSPGMMKKMEKLFFEKRAVYLWGVVEDKSIREVVSKILLLEADKPGKEIKLYINSPGGVVTSGMVLFDTMTMISSPVSTICMGLAASMGSILLCAGTKGKRYIYPHGEVMIHQPSSGTRGKVTDQEIDLHESLRVKNLLEEIMAKNTGQEKTKVHEDMERDRWMTASETKKYGIVDKIINTLPRS